MEKRESPRFAVELPASFSGTGANGGGLVSRLSTGGCTIASDDPVQAGTFLVLHIQFPAQYSPLKVDLAEVRWVKGREFGLKFIRLRKEEKDRLRKLLHYLKRGAA
jgi:hypothetical protein